MKKEIIQTDAAPPPRPGRAQAVRYGNLLFLSGQVPRDTKDRWITGDIQTQTRQVIENLKAVLDFKLALCSVDLNLGARRAR